MEEEQLNKRLSELERKWLAGTISPEEEKEYMEWYNQDDSKPVLIPEQLGEEETGHRERLFSAIQTHMNKEVPDSRTPVLRIRNRRWIAAASVLLLLSAGAYLWFTGNAITEPPTAYSNHQLRNDALPGRDGAVLTLADGKKVLLDSLGNGVISTQGKTTVSISSGRLVYDAREQEGTTLYNTMTTPNGRQYQLVLPDGTLVWLNAASSITYPTAFIGKERKVTVNGEAYFEVAKNKKKPFIVDIDGKSSVEVLGTHFNINSYGDEGNIKTTLLEGSVKVTRGHNSTVLRPGQQSAVSTSSQSENGAGISVSSLVDLDQVMAWKQGYFQFSRTDLKVVMRELARWYNVEVVYENGVPDKTFIGKLPRDANASEVLKALGDVGVHVRIEDRKLIVMP